MIDTEGQSSQSISRSPAFNKAWMRVAPGNISIRVRSIRVDTPLLQWPEEIAKRTPRRMASFVLSAAGGHF